MILSSNKYWISKAVNPKPGFVSARPATLTVTVTVTVDDDDQFINSYSLLDVRDLNARVARKTEQIMMMMMISLSRHS